MKMALKDHCSQVDMVVHTYNSGTQEADAGRLQVQGQSGLHSKILFQKVLTKRPLLNLSFVYQKAIFFLKLYVLFLSLDLNLCKNKSAAY
jgi:hypothetical protein